MAVLTKVRKNRGLRQAVPFQDVQQTTKHPYTVHLLKAASFYGSAVATSF